MKNSKLKRLVSFLMAVSMVMSIMVMPAAAEEGAPADPAEITETTPPCTHDFVNGVCTLCTAEHDCSFETETGRTEPTCGEAGSVTKTCSCGKTNTTAIDATGEHNYVEGYCEVCGYPKPCTHDADCDAPQHENCIKLCTGHVNCESTVHLDTCLKTVPCSCVQACSENKVCPVCVDGGECKGAETAEKIAAVQTLINALPTTYNFSESAAVKVQYDACTEAIAALTETERAELDMTNYAAAAQPTVIDDSIISIDGTPYNTLNEAFANADGKTIVIKGTVTLTESITVPAGKTITLDLNGQTVSLETNSDSIKQLLTNNGTLTIKDSGTNGTLTYKNTAASTAFAANTILNAGSLTITGGTISNTSNAGIHYGVDNNSTSRNVNLNVTGGSILCPGNGGYPDGIRLFANGYTNSVSISTTGTVTSVWMQNPSDGSAGKNTENRTASLNISNGSFERIELEPSSNFTVNIVDGTFDSVVIYDAANDPRAPKNFITGGTFNNDVSAFLPVGYAQDEDGKVEAFEIKQTTDEKTQVVIPESAGSKITVNETVTSTNVSQVIANDQEAVQEVLDTITDGAGATGIEISMKVELETYNEQTNTLTFNVAPHVQPVDDKGEKKGDGAPISEVSEKITFRLPMPKGTAGKYASVSHKHGNNDAVNIGSYLIEENEGSCYITLSSKQFSEYTATIDVDADAYVAKLSSGASYKSLQDALTAATAGDEVILLKSVTLPDQNFIQIKENVTLNLNGKTLRGNVLGTLEINGGTYLTNDPDYTDGYKMVGPTGSENFAYISDDAVITVAADGITISGGTMELGQDMNTDPNHTITVSQSATFIVPAGKTLYIRKSGIANGTLTVNGTVVLVKTEVTEGNFITGTLKAPSGLNVITNIADHKVVYNDGTYTVAEKTYVASIGTTQYETLQEAVTAAQAAQGSQEILLISNVELTSAVVIPTGDSLNLNGKTLTGDAVGTVKMNGGTYITAQDYNMVAPAGDFPYLTEDAVFVIAADGITIDSGSVTLGKSWGTLASHTITVAEDAEFTVPTGLTLVIGGNAVIEGELKVEGNGKVELQQGATLKAPNGLNVITTVTDHKVVYNTETGIYSVAACEYVAQVGTGTDAVKYESLQTAVDAANGKTVTLLKNVTLTDTLNITKDVTFNGNNYTLSISTTSKNLISVNTGGKLTITGGIFTGKIVTNDGQLTIPGKITDTTINPAKFSIKDNVLENSLEDYFSFVLVNGLHEIRQDAHVIITEGNTTTTHYYTTSVTLNSLIAANKDKGVTFDLTQDDVISTDHEISGNITINLNGHKISGTGSLVQKTAGSHLFLKGIGGKTDLKLGTGDKADFDSNGAITIKVAEDTIDNLNIGYGEIGVTAHGNTDVDYVYSIGKDTLLIVNADGSIDSMSTEIANSEGQVIILRNANGKPLYTIAINDGISQTQYQYFVVGSNKVLVFESNAFFDGFADVYVGTTKLTKGVHYTAERGSTIVTLKNSYLKTLSKDTYTLTMTFKDGQTVSGNFYVVNTAKPAVTPQTGDIIMGSVAVMVIAAAGLGILFFLNKKKKK